MRNQFSKILGTVCILGVGQVSYANNLTEHPLHGSWQSNKLESLKELSKAGFSSQEIDKVAFLFGQMQVEISKDTYTTYLNGQTQQSSYSLISSENNCYKIEVEHKTQQLCIKDNLLYVPSYKGSLEVFERK